jgi:hypothetical protein
MSKLFDMQKQGKVAALFDFRKNTVLDLSGNGSVATPTSLSWKNGGKGRCVDFSSSSAGFSCAHVSAHALTSGVYVLFCEPITSQFSNQFFMEKAAGTGTRVLFYSTNGSNVSIYDGTLNSTLTASIIGKRFLAARWGSSSKADFFIDGAYAGPGTSASATITAPTGALTAATVGSKLKVLLFALLTEATNEDISELYDELMAERGATGEPKRGFVWNNPLVNEDFTVDSYWTKGTGWTISGGKASSDGTQTAVSDLSQTALKIGRTYTVKMRVSGRTAGTVTLYAGTSAGTARSADGEYSELIRCAGNESLIIRADADFVGSIEVVEVQEGAKSVYGDDMADATPTFANVTAGVVDGTDFSVVSGSFRVSEAASGKKWLECVTAGVAYAKQDRAYGTFVFEANKSDGGQPYFMFVSDTAGTEAATGQDCYDILLTSGESVRLRRAVAGVGANLAYTVDSYVSHSTDYKLAVSRSHAGAFTLYVKGGAFTQWTLVDMTGGTGTNPTTDTSTTSSRHFVVDLDAGDKFRFLGVYEGVLTINELEALH